MTKEQLRTLGKRIDFYYFPLQTIQVESGFNARTDYGDIEALALDILENGLKSPLRVRIDEDSPILVDGERRLRALHHIHDNNLGEIPRIVCILDDKKNSPVNRLFSQLSHNSGKPFSLLEKANLYARIRKEANITAAEISRRAQTTKTAVADALTIHDHASPLILSHLAQDLYSPTCALEIIRSHKDDHTAQDQLADQTLATAHQAGKTKASPKHIPRKDPDPDTTPELNEEPSDTTTPPEITKISTPDTVKADADPSAIEKIKAAPSQDQHPFNNNSGGGSGNGGGGSGKGNVVDSRIERLNDLIEEIAEDDSLFPDEDRMTTLDLIMDYIDGQHKITRIKDHLLDQ